MEAKGSSLLNQMERYNSFRKPTFIMYQMRRGSIHNDFQELQCFIESNKLKNIFKKTVLKRILSYSA